MTSIPRFFRWTGCTIVLIASLAGCTAEDGGFAADTLGPEVADAATLGVFSPPTLSELQSRLNLTPEQSARVEALLKDWRADAEALPRPGDRRHEGRRGSGRGGADGPPRGERGFQRGDGPRADFLIGIVEILDTPQIEKLGAFMKERRSESLAAMAEEGPRGRKRGNRSDFRERMAETLGLTGQQRDAAQAAMKTYREGLRSLRDRFESDAITAEEFRDRAKELRAGMETELEAALGADTFRKLRERRSALRGQRGEHRDDTDQAGRMLEMLNRALSLTDAQRSQVRSILESRAPQTRALRDQVRNGTMEPEDALYEGHRIKEDGRRALESILTPEQRERFDALQSLLPGGRRGR